MHFLNPIIDNMSSFYIHGSFLSPVTFPVGRNGQGQYEKL